ncbi:uncharacterized protein AMSG_04703 [Thecamonas trahens ATCC 50062]|uniref:Activator of Hsp90 ATPase AHSA1-like N-terminal domain-containing protein n=1 Tax=Thecamonas trahens ATCC 50062 TaxID=461836 RepID=A0A0L0DCC2_THETB|nr:hypothetical protein AMSG_04703 [Thecamonas trahens ATCC 50062]KNC48958.1 hypothetical protein AMSG_04703 [Thecamonas trahens ATCC 50062]|eukprot:XP_013758375.1 hypothetical protein AMSG_04703 [Thecamonas trahens ATCC 50062]
MDMDPAVAAAEEEQKKNAGGYRYWARNVPDSQRLPEQIASEAEAQVSVVPGASAWNTGGTWEEKSVLSHTRDFLEVRMLGIELHPQCRVCGVESVTGDASVVFVRQKKRPGFELDVTLKWAWYADADAAAAAVPGVEDDEAVTGL